MGDIMSFADFYINDTRKQHLNLSQYAWNVIESDLYLFSNGIEPLKINPFLNRIFLNYTEANLFPCNLDQMIAEKKEIYKNAIFSFYSEKDIESITNIIIEKNDLKDLYQKISSYQKGIGRKIYIQAETYQKLISIPSESYIEKLFYKPGKYLKAIFEEYSKLSYMEREKIYYATILTRILDAIDLHYTLYIETGNQAYEVIPYGIFSDHFHTYQYLVGLSRPYHHQYDVDFVCASFRVARMQSVKTNRNDKRKLTDSEEEILLSTMKYREVPFLLNDTMRVKIRFSSKGLQQYQNLLYLRPPLIQKIDTYTYVFQATFLQIEAYFFKFGSDIEILEPENIRNHFIEKYQKALSKYQNDNDKKPTLRAKKDL